MNARQKCKHLKKQIRYSNNLNHYKINKKFSKQFKESLNLSKDAERMYVRQLIINDLDKFIRDHQYDIIINEEVNSEGDTIYSTELIINI